MSKTLFILPLLLLSPLALAVTPSPPKAPKGLDPCPSPLVPHRGLPREIGERLTYQLEMFGFELGTANFSIKRRGRFEGRPVTEYAVNIDSASLLEWISTIEGSGATLIEDGRSHPLAATTRYRYHNCREQERLTYSQNGRHVHSERHHNGRRSVKETMFAAPVVDFLTGFYLLRGLKQQDHGCTIVYSGHKAFTLWIHPEADEMLKTANGPVSTTRYRLRYGSERDKRVKKMNIWISKDTARIPIQITSPQGFKPRAILQGYRPPTQ